jgi:hypothetical protein
LHDRFLWPAFWAHVFFVLPSHHVLDTGQFTVISFQGTYSEIGVSGVIVPLTNVSQRNVFLFWPLVLYASSVRALQLPFYDCLFFMRITSRLSLEVSFALANVLSSELDSTHRVTPGSLVVSSNHVCLSIPLALTEHIPPKRSLAEDPLSTSFRSRPDYPLIVASHDRRL